MLRLFPAIEDARRNAALNNITNAEFFTGKAEEVLPEQYEKNKVYADVIVVDPPRKGCDQVCLDTILKMHRNGWFMSAATPLRWQEI